MDTYFSLQGSCEGLYKEKGSKFIARGFAVENEDEVKDILTSLREEYYDARHVCYAYRLGETGEVFRINDDGEPSGTAGKPIYGQLLSYELKDVLLVVVRYFGGTKLGVSGLIQAYKQASREAIESGVIIEKMIKKQIRIRFSYELMNVVMRMLRDVEIEKMDQFYEEQCEIVLEVRRSLSDSLYNRLSQVYGLEVEL